MCIRDRCLSVWVVKLRNLVAPTDNKGICTLYEDALSCLLYTSLNPEKGHKFMPYIVVVIDEFGDLIMTAGKERCV